MLKGIKTLSLIIINYKFGPMRSALLLLIIIFGGQILFAQQDSQSMVKYTPDYRFKDGLYLNFGQVKQNDPIPAARVISKETPGDFNFFRNLVKEETIGYFDDFGSKIELKADQVWGFCQDGKLFINHNGEFNRIPIVGQVCHFIADVTVYESYNDPYFYDRYDYYYNPYHQRPYNRTSKSREMRQYLLRFDSGEILPYDRESILIVLMEDAELYDEYSKLRKRKQRDLMFFFLRRYNEKNPIFLPKR